MSTLIKAENIRRSYNGREVLRIESLEVMAGETLCLMGPNGAGKSTLVRILNLVEKTDTGAVWFGGEKVGTRSFAARRRMAGVFQRPHMFGGSVADNVACGLRMRKLPSAEIARRAHRTLESLGLSHLAGQDARRLSGGEAQRVALARAIALEPEVLFLDEPAGNLDPQARRDFHRDLHSIVSQRHTTAIYVTHYLDEAMDAGDRIAVMKDGELRQIGSSLDVFHAPADAFVAGLLGFENLLPGRVTEIIEGGAVVMVAGSRIYTRMPASGDVFACVRGQDVTLHQPSWGLPAPTANRFPGIVRSVAPAGAAHQVKLDCGFQLVATVTRPVMQELGLTPGIEVEARVDEPAVHLVGAGAEGISGPGLEAGYETAALSEQTPGGVMNNG